jgi:hypothetical protein
MAKHRQNERRGKRRVVVELYRRDETGRIVAEGRLVTEYAGARRGGVVVDVGSSGPRHAEILER